MLDCFVDGFLDTLKLLPYLFITFVLLEFIEHKLNNKELLVKYQKCGPIVGGVLGALPQCGFGTMAANLFSNKIITLGTLISIFLSTSDEMLAIMLSEQASLFLLLRIIGFKIFVGILVGIVVDLIYRKRINTSSSEISRMCDEEHCSCDHDGIILSSIKHTLKIGLFILIANLVINFIIFMVGEDSLSNLLQYKSIVTYFMASVIGLIPNCASSVIITELYLSGFISVGHLMSGLLTGSGLGILLLFKSNKNLKENLLVLLVIYFVGVFVGMLVDFIV